MSKAMLVLFLCLFLSSFSFGKNYDKEAVSLYHAALIESNTAKKEKLLAKALKLQPTDSKIAFLYGKTLFKLKKTDAGVKAFNIAKKDPKIKYRIYRFIGEYFYYKKNFTQANVYFKKLIKTKSQDNYLNNYRLGEINGHRGLRNYDDSIKYFAKAYKLRKYKLNKDLLWSIAQNYYHLDNYKKTIEYLENYPHSNKNNKAAFKMLIISYDKTNSADKLKSNIVSYLKTWPYDEWALFLAKSKNIPTPDDAFYE